MPAARPQEVASRKRIYREGRDSAFEYLELGVPLGITFWDDHFQGDLFYGGAAPGVYQSTASGAASAGAALNLGAANGEILLDPGTDNGGRSDLSLGLHYSGSRFAVCAVRFDMRDAITSSKFEVGFTDVVSGTDAGAVNVKATPTFNADDAVVLVRDTNDDTNLTLVGVRATVAATAYDFTTTLALGTFYYGVVALRGTRAVGYLLNADGDVIERQPTSGYMESAITAATLLTPWVFVQNRSAAQRRLYVCRLKAYQFTTPSS